MAGYLTFYKYNLCLQTYLQIAKWKMRTQIIFVTIKYLIFFLYAMYDLLIQQLHTLNRVLCSKQYTDQVLREWERRSDRRDRQ